MKFNALLILIALVGRVYGQEKLNQTFTGVSELRINTASGNCTLVKGPDSSIGVKLVHEYSDDVFEPEVRQEGDRLFIKEHFRKNSSGKSPQWTITVPDGLEVNFSTGSGSLEASNLKLTLSSRSGSGEMSLTNCGGEVNASTGSGSINVSDYEGEFDVNTGSGTVQIAKAKGVLSFNAGSGDIRLENCEGKFAANTGSGSIAGKKLLISDRSAFNSGSGNAQVILTKSPEYNIAVNSGSGDAILDFDGNEVKGKLVMKANKRNGEIKAPFKFDQEEEIENGDQVIIQKTVVRGSDDIKISVSTGSGEAVVKE